MFFSSSFIMRYPNCVSQFLSIQHDRYTKNNLEMIKKKTWRVMELVHWTNSSYIPLMGFEQTGHSWKATGTSLSGAGLRPEGPRRFWGDAAAWGWERAKVTGERWQLNNKNHQNFQERLISLMKNGEFQKEPGYLTVTWLTKKGGFHHEKDGFDLATIENSLKNRISPSTIKI